MKKTKTKGQRLGVCSRCQTLQWLNDDNFCNSCASRKKEAQTESSPQTQNNLSPRSLHTPGPWLRSGTLVYTLTESRTGKAIYDYDRQSNPKMINRFSAHVQQANHGQTTATHEEIEANARLMAASPDLLEACKELRDVAAACFRVINRAGQLAVDDLEGELSACSITDGFGKRADLLIAMAEGREAPSDRVP